MGFYGMAKILVVDDSEIIRVQLITDLTNVGHEVVGAFNGLNGIEVLSKNKDVDLIISDVNMPEMDGPSMCKKLHDDPEFSHIPIIMLTTQSNAELKTNCKKYGVIAWVTKPYKPKGFIIGINKVLAKA